MGCALTARARRSAASPRPRRVVAAARLSELAARNVVNGKQQFVAKCGACHALARAGTDRRVGPEPRRGVPARARQDGFGSSTFEGIVHRQILHPTIPAGRPCDRQGSCR